MLTIDIGNSRIKWATFLNAEFTEYNAVAYNKEDFEHQLACSGFSADDEQVLISYVGCAELKKRLVLWLDTNGFSHAQFIETGVKQCGVVNSYDVPGNMGVDRWLAMIAAYNEPGRAPDQAVCVIDCGTAITFDVVGVSGKHLGGLIMPGYRMMRRSLNVSTGRISLADNLFEKSLDSLLLATSTQHGVDYGCAQIIVYGLGAIIEQYIQSNNKEVLCLVTGGDGEWVSDALKYKSQYLPYLVHQGLSLVALEQSQSGIKK